MTWVKYVPEKFVNNCKCHQYTWQHFLTNLKISILMCDGIDGQILASF